MKRTFFPAVFLLVVSIIGALGGFADAAPLAPAHLALTAPALAGDEAWCPTLELGPEPKPATKKNRK